MKSETRTTSYRVPALEKGLDILEALSFANMPLSLANLSKTLDKSSSEIFRMVDCLEKRGYILKDEFSGNYMLTLKLFELSHTHSPVEMIMRTSYRPMLELAQTVRESCHLSVLKNGVLVVLSQAESPNNLRLSVEVGASFSIIHTVSGRLLLAHLLQEELEYTLKENEEFQAFSEREKKGFLKKLEEIRILGYSASEDETLRGINDVSVLIGSQRSGTMAALAIPYLTSDGGSGYREKLLQALISTVQTINQMMGVS